VDAEAVPAGGAEPAPLPDDLRPRLEAVRERLGEITRALTDPEVLADQGRVRELARERARLEPIQARAEERAAVHADLLAARAMLADAAPADREWLEEEVRRLGERLRALEEEIRRLLAPRDPRDGRGVVLEIRAGAGGEEAALFAADLARMYTRYAERRGWRTEVLGSSETGIGGFKEIALGIEGPDVWSRLKFESGVHRVQRVPVTEAAGRIHTSTATVAVLPEADEVEVEIRPEDLEIDVYRASGAGGQHVNRTESAVRIVHRPTGIVVTCQDERSQIKNREKAMKVLRARLYDLELRRQQAEIASERRAQVGSGERSERIRTYNFPQNRVSEERIKLTLYRLRDVLDGDLDLIVEPLLADEQARRLRGIGTG
jgi:peptide chain release factor 1